MSSYITRLARSVGAVMLKVSMMTVIPIVLAVLIMKWELTQALRHYKQSQVHQRVTLYWENLSHLVSERLIKPLQSFGTTKWENIKERLFK